MEEIKIKISPTDLGKQKAFHTVDHFILIDDKWFRYYNEFTGTEAPADEDGNYKEFGEWVDTYRVYDWRVLRKVIVGVDMYLTTSPIRWKLTIVCQGASDYHIYFKLRAKAEEARDIILKSINELAT